MKKTYLAGLIMAVMASCPLLAAVHPPPSLVFNDRAPINDLQGSLAAQVQFAQSQILPAHPQAGDNQPRLVAQRKSLLLVRPLLADADTPMSVTALDGAGRELGTLSLNPPNLLPRTAYYLDGTPEEGVDFTPGPGTGAVINSSSELARLSDPTGAFLLGKLQPNALVTIQTTDGRWVRDIHLPGGAELEGKMVRLVSNAGYNSTVYYSGRQITLSRGQSLQFKFVGDQWIRDGELENNGITYARDSWSAVLPADWIRPGLSLQLSQGALSGELADLQIGAPSELLIHTIDIGMLTSPRDRFDFAKDPEAQREYFQTVPTSRLIVSQYAPLYLPEVMLPDGTLLTDFDPSQGGWHEGTMRQRIGKELISLGIDNANYGINSTAGEGESSHPYVVAQLAAHNSRGKYANGVQVHGGSGGGGIVTLDASLGNEFSHEVGHNYGLGHYVGGFAGSVHRSAEAANATWGWDGDKNRFIPNFGASRTGQSSCLDGQCQAPIDGRPFGFDAMAGGAPLSGFNRFTLYTPNSAALIQRFLESKAVFDASSPTGFSKWDAATATMKPYEHRVEVREQVNAPVGELGEAGLTALLAEYDLVRVAMWDGYWTRNIQLPAASAANAGRIVTVDHGASYNSTLFVNGQQITVSRGFKKSYTSDGSRWQEGAPVDASAPRKPQAFGVPVTTLVGYYDPQGQLPGYIYPALHGAYGFGYGDDADRLTAGDCQLRVETREGQLRFRLANHRLSASVMNKFHVNVPTASEPSGASVLCRNQSQAEAQLAPAPAGLGYSVNGRALAAR